MMVSATTLGGAKARSNSRLLLPGRVLRRRWEMLLDAFRNYLLLIANAELDSELRKKVWGFRSGAGNVCSMLKEDSLPFREPPKRNCGPGCARSCSIAAATCG